MPGDKLIARKQTREPRTPSVQQPRQIHKRMTGKRSTTSASVPAVNLYIRPPGSLKFADSSSTAVDAGRCHKCQISQPNRNPAPSSGNKDAEPIKPQSS